MVYVLSGKGWCSEGYVMGTIQTDLYFLNTSAATAMLTLQYLSIDHISACSLNDIYLTLRCVLYISVVPL